MGAMATTFEFPVVVTPLALPNTQNHVACAVTGRHARAAMLDPLQTVQLDAFVRGSKSIADLFSTYFRGYANTSCAVTCDMILPFHWPTHYEVPARRTPFGHLDFLSAPVEGIYFDPDDVAGG